MSDEGLALEELIEFFDARDQFLGVGNSTNRQDLAEGFRRLAASRHSEARFVCSLFPSGPPKDNEEAKAVLLAQGEHPVALCYAGLVSVIAGALMRRAAELGNTFATWWVLFSDEDALRGARRAAEAGDREGWFWVGSHLWRVGGECPEAVSAFGEAARLGHASGMRWYGTTAFSKDDPERYLWLGRAARKSQQWGGFMSEASNQRLLHDQGADRRAVLMMIGRMLRGHEDKLGEENRPSAAWIVRKYEECIARAREALICWMLCARSLGLYKDVSLIVARTVWEGRDAFF